MKQNANTMLSLLFDFHLVSELDGNLELSKEEQEQMDKYSSAYSSCTHVFYNILYLVKDELNAKTFYISDENSPCLKWFNEKCSYRESISAKVLEYAIEDAYGMVLSDKEKDIQHEKQVEELKKRRVETYDEIKKAKDKLKKHNTRKNLKNLKHLIYEIDYLNRKINEKFSSRRIFGGKRLMLEINNAYANALKDKARRTNRDLSDTYLTDEEKEQVEKIKKEKQILFRQKRTGIFKTQGDASNHGNRYFELTDDPSVIILKFSKKLHIPIKLDNLNGYEEILKKIYKLSKDKKVSLGMTLNTKSKTIAISYSAESVYGDEFKIHNQKKKRVMSIDLNPDDVGYVVVDWFTDFGFHIVDSGVYSIKILNDEEKSLDGKGLKSSDSRRKYYANKRIHETREIAHALTLTAAYYKCDIFSMERLKFNNYYNRNRSKGVNKLVNKMWKRTEFVRIIEKDCSLYHIKSMQVLAAYSSFVGNLVFRSIGLPDMCLAAFEMGRRTFMLRYMNVRQKNQDKILEDEASSDNNTNTKKSKRKSKGILFPDMRHFKRFGAKSLEEFGDRIPDNLHGCLTGDNTDAATLYDVYKVISTQMVRVKLSSYSQKELKKSTFRFRSQKSLIRRIMVLPNFKDYSSGLSPDNDGTLSNGSAFEQ